MVYSVRELALLGLHSPHSTTMCEKRHVLPSSVPKYGDVTLMFFTSQKFMFKSFLSVGVKRPPLDCTALTLISHCLVAISAVYINSLCICV